MGDGGSHELRVTRRERRHPPVRRDAVALSLTLATPQPPPPTPLPSAHAHALSAFAYTVRGRACQWIILVDGVGVGGEKGDGAGGCARVAKKRIDNQADW